MATSRIGATRTPILAGIAWIVVIGTALGASGNGQPVVEEDGSAILRIVPLCAACEAIGRWSGVIPSGAATYVWIAEGHSARDGGARTDQAHIVELILRVRSGTTEEGEQPVGVYDGFVVVGLGTGQVRAFRIAHPDLRLSREERTVRLEGQVRLELYGDGAVRGANEIGSVLTVEATEILEDRDWACAIWAPDVLRILPELGDWEPRGCVGREKLANERMIRDLEEHQRRSEPTRKGSRRTRSKGR